MNKIKKTILTLVALLAVTTGAWADETPLLTIESKGYTSFTSGSMTFDDKVTVTFSNSVYNDGDYWGWFADGGSLLTVAGTNGYTITSCKFYTFEGTAKTGYTVAGESPSVYLSNYKVYTDDSKSVDLGKFGISKIEVFGAAASPASSGPEVDGPTIVEGKPQWTFTMPGGNVTLEPEYYPQAALATDPTAINDVPATTDGAIVNAGTVANIGETTTAQGTVMYHVSQTEMTDAALQALAADQWTADVPTAQSLAQGQAYVYYYVRGNDSDNDDEIFNDGDILATNALTVTIAAEPTYAVTFADGVNPEPPAEPEWTASPAAGVKKGETVTVTYTGTKKVIGVKAEKKAAAAAARPLAEAVAADLGKIAGADGNIYDTKAAAETAGTTAVAMIAYVGNNTGNTTYTHGLAIALADEEGQMNWNPAKSTCEGKSAVTNAAWQLPSQNQWKAMFKAFGDNDASYSGLNTAITNAGGTALMGGNYYWTSTPDGAHVFCVSIDNGNDIWEYGYVDEDSYCVRACLAF